MRLLGVNLTPMLIDRKGDLGAPFLYQYGNNGDGQFISLPTYSNDKARSQQFDTLLNVNLRYGILDYLEIFGNANGYFQSSNPKYTNVKDQTNFAGANIGAMLTLYKGETFRLVIGDNSDIVNNAIFDDNSSGLNFFKGHTFMLNLVTRKESDNAFASNVLQLYYRLNLDQKHKDESFRNGDEWGIRTMWQSGKDNKLMYISGSASLRSSDKINGVYTGHQNNFDGIALGFGFGFKYDINSHLGWKLEANYMNYSIEYNASYASMTLGFYFK